MNALARGERIRNLQKQANFLQRLMWDEQTCPSGNDYDLDALQAGHEEVCLEMTDLSEQAQ